MDGGGLSRLNETGDNSHTAAGSRFSLKMEGLLEMVWAGMGGIGR